MVLGCGLVLFFVRSFAGGYLEGYFAPFGDGGARHGIRDYNGALWFIHADVYRFNCQAKVHQQGYRILDIFSDHIRDQDLGGRSGQDLIGICAIVSAIPRPAAGICVRPAAGGDPREFFLCQPF